jgi:YesN/AraC family two-component response regulator
VEVLITDAQLPSMDGFQLADEARRAIPALAVIIISGGHGAPGYTLLRKPFSRDQLASTLQQVTGAG